MLNKVFFLLFIILFGEDLYVIFYVLVGIFLMRDWGFFVLGKRFFCRCFCMYWFMIILIVVYDCG